ncbi:deoxynucleotidyltransferase terminal-interacting protein 1 isoform X2 [Lacerta agilis]|uniref:deoxynucleotidyltransferase terminal-interacting protein 1 isoform X2 n=1 Tax=Lacerta agilis TaxID=80427 RepID=UPI001419DC9E|nr:deoxynucleotidyltransferase terminal-interacting protein 1 isoform X2 [Lacerta agilis]
MGAAREAEQQPAPEPERGDEEDEEDEEAAAAAAAGQEEAEEEAGPGGSGAASPWNIMIKHRLVQRRGRRSQVMTSFTDPVVSMDLLRAVLQPSINEEIQAVFSKYMKFFQKAAGNVRENVGEDVDTEQLIQETCRSCLEQAKLLFCDSKKSAARLPHEVPAMKRAKPMEEEMSQQGSPIPRKMSLFRGKGGLQDRARQTTERLQSGARGKPSPASQCREMVPSGILRGSQRPLPLSLDQGPTKPSGWEEPEAGSTSSTPTCSSMQLILKTSTGWPNSST